MSSSSFARGNGPGGLPPAASTSYAAPVSGRAAASPVPLIVGLAAVVVSIALAVYIALQHSLIRDLGIELKIVTSDAWWMSFLGYLLTPVVVIACYGWDGLWQRNALRANRNFVQKPAWTRTLLWVTGFSVLVGAWHVLNLGVLIAKSMVPS